MSLAIVLESMLRQRFLPGDCHGDSTLTATRMAASEWRDAFVIDKGDYFGELPLELPFGQVRPDYCHVTLFTFLILNAPFTGGNRC